MKIGQKLKVAPGQNFVPKNYRSILNDNNRKFQQKFAIAGIFYETSSKMGQKVTRIDRALINKRVVT